MSDGLGSDSGGGGSALALYVHFPFCASKCHYCDFNSRPGGSAERVAYLEALLEEVARQPRAPVRTVYFGGGTPTLYGPGELGLVLEKLRQAFDVYADAEVTTEANPGTVSECDLHGLREAGFTRLSIGVQSLDDRELAMLGRCHSAQQAAETVRAAGAAGFENVSIDLIRGLPGQTARQWMSGLEAAVALAPAHMSVYGLTLEPGTELARRVASGEVPAPRVANDAGLVVRTARRLAAAGLERYEVSNYARPGFECRHNLVYWRNESYLGLGAGAWSYVAGCRRRNVADIGQYIRAVESGSPLTEEEETLSCARALGETLMLGLRLTSGVSIAGLYERYGADVRRLYGEPLARLERAGYVAAEGDNVMATEAGMLVLNAVVAELLA